MEKLKEELKKFNEKNKEVLKERLTGEEAKKFYEEKIGVIDEIIRVVREEIERFSNLKEPNSVVKAVELLKEKTDSEKRATTYGSVLVDMLMRVEPDEKTKETIKDLLSESEKLFLLYSRTDETLKNFSLKESERIRKEYEKEPKDLDGLLKRLDYLFSFKETVKQCFGPLSYVAEAYYDVFNETKKIVESFLDKTQNESDYRIQKILSFSKELYGIEKEPSKEAKEPSSKEISVNKGIDINR